MSANPKAASGESAPAPQLNPPPRRILVKEVNWLGDLVMSLPALRAIRHTWPKSHLAVLVKRELAGFFNGASFIDQVIPYSTARGIRALAGMGRIVGEIRSHRFDLTILFPNSFESALWVTLARVPRRAGFATDARSAMLTNTVAPRGAALDGHQVEYWLSMVRETVGAEGSAGDYSIEAHEESRDRMQEWLAARSKMPEAPLVAVAPAAAFGPAKEWPPELYARLINILAENFGVECVLVGTPGEREKCVAVAAASGAGAMVAAGETDIAELIGLLSLCTAFVGNDSGCMHLAGALGIPTVAIFGSTNPARTGPLGPKTRVLWKHLECSPCLARHCRFGHYNCLKEISPADAALALKDLGALG